MMTPYRPPSPHRKAAPAPYVRETQASGEAQREATAAGAQASAAAAAAAVGVAEMEGFQAQAVRAVSVPAPPAEEVQWKTERGGGEGEGEEAQLRRDFSAGPRNFLETLALQDLLVRQASQKEASLAPSGPAFPGAQQPAPTATAEAPLPTARTSTAGAGAGSGAGAVRNVGAFAMAESPLATPGSALRRPVTADPTTRVPGLLSSPATRVPGRSPLHPASVCHPGSRRVDPSMLPGFIPLTRPRSASRGTGSNPSRATLAGSNPSPVHRVRDGHGQGLGREVERERSEVGEGGRKKGSGKETDPMWGYSDKPLASTVSTGYSDKLLAPTASRGYSDRGRRVRQLECRTDSSESASEVEFPWRGDDPDTPSELSLDLSLKSASTESEGVLSTGSEGVLSTGSEGVRSDRSLRSSSSEKEVEGDKEGAGARRHSTGGAPSATPAVTGHSGRGEAGGAPSGLAIRRLLGIPSRFPGSVGAPPAVPLRSPACTPTSMPFVSLSAKSSGTPEGAPGSALEAAAAVQGAEGQHLREEEKGEPEMSNDAPPNPNPSPRTLSAPRESPLVSLPSSGTSVSGSTSASERDQEVVPSSSTSVRGSTGETTSATESDQGGVPREGQVQQGPALGMPSCGMPGAAPCGGATASAAPGAMTTQGERLPPEKERRLSEEFSRASSRLPPGPTSPLVSLPSSGTTASRADTYHASVGYASGVPGYRGGGSHSPLSSHMGSAPGTPGHALGDRTPGRVPGTPGSALGTPGRVGGGMTSALVAYGAHTAGPLAHPWFTPAGSMPGTPYRQMPPQTTQGGAGALAPLSGGRALKAEPRERSQPKIPFSWQQGGGNELALVPGAGSGSPGLGPGRFRNGQGLLVGPPPTQASGSNGRDDELANAVVIRSKGTGPGQGVVAAQPEMPAVHPGQVGGVGGWSGGVLNDLPPRWPPPQFSWSRVEAPVPKRQGLYGQGGSLVVGPDKELKRYLRVKAMQMAQPALPMLPAPGSVTEEVRD